jgi:uncharacterized protein YjbJ (UPF0337 family)
LDPQHEESDVNQYRIEGAWQQIQGRVQEQWGRFGDDEFESISIKFDPLVSSIQESYDITEDEAERLLQQSIGH